jgi:hypothetical protein
MWEKSPTLKLTNHAVGLRSYTLGVEDQYNDETVCPKTRSLAG